MKRKELIKEIEYLFYEPTSMMEARLEMVLDSLLEVFSKKELKKLIINGVKKMENEEIEYLYERLKEWEEL